MSPLITKWITFTPAVDLNPPVGATLYADIYTMKISGSVKVTPFNSRPGGVYYVRGPISDGVKQPHGVSGRQQPSKARGNSRLGNNLECTSIHRSRIAIEDRIT